MTQITTKKKTGWFMKEKPDPVEKVLADRNRADTIQRATEPRTAVEIMDDMVKAPTLDRFFDNDPSSFSDGDFWELIATLRSQRAIFIEKDNK